jgi:hypothetical protein
MTVTNEQREALEAVADKATEVAGLIRQDWGSGAPEGGVQTRVNVDIPGHGPDHVLLNVERLLGDVIVAIEAYLQRPPEG